MSSKDQIWAPFAKEIGAEFIQPGLLTGTILENYKKWKIILDTPKTGGYHSECSYTRIRLAYLKKRNLDFKLYNKSFYSSIKKLFTSLEENESICPDFNKKFGIQCKEESLIPKLLNQDILNQINSLKYPLLIEDKKELTRVDEAMQNYIDQSWPGNIGVLHYFNDKVIKDTSELKKLLCLFKKLIDSLVDMDIAHDRKPDFEFELYFENKKK